MDSLKTNLLQQQEFPRKNTQKPYILTLIFVLTLIVAAIVTVTTVIIIRQSSPGSDYLYVEPSPSKSVQAICSFAPYKRLCSSTLLSVISTNASSTEFDTLLSPENIIFHSFQVAVTQLTHLANITNPDNIPELRECGTLLNKEVSGLNDFVASSKNLYLFTELEVDEYLEAFKRIKTYQQTCLDKLEESGSMVIDEIRSNVQITRTYMCNIRAILLNKNTILDNIYSSPSSDFDYYSKYFDWLSYEFIIVYVPQYVLLIVLLILMLKLYR